MTQVDRVEAHILAGKTITPAQAIAVYGIFRLSSVIEDLRQRGHSIDCVLKYDEMGKQYGEYRLRRDIAPRSKVQVRRGYGIGLPLWVRRLKLAEVEAVRGDAALVRFVRGGLRSCEWVNVKELVRAD